MKKLLATILILITFFTIDINAQFGKNIVQYQTFEWKYIESDHFNVYFHDDQVELAKFTALSAEEALKSIQKTLNYKIEEKIRLIVYNSHNEYQQTNVIQMFMSEGIGGVTEGYKNRVVIPFQGSYAQFKHVIHHELVHAVLNDLLFGGTIQSSLSTNSFRLPTWMNEGFAEWQSIGGMDNQTDMFMRDITISEQLPALNRISGYMSYRAGQTFYWYIAEKYGKEKVGELINRLKVYKNLDQAFLNSFKMKFEDFSDKWEKDIKKYYWPDLEVFEDIDDFAEKVTDRKEIGNFYNSSPSISPNGDRLAFISEDGGVLGISVMDVDDMESIEQIVSSFRSQDFEDLNMLTPGISWNPEGTHLAISAKAGPEDAIFITEVASGDYEKILLGIKSITSVQWSPDGKRLAFIGTVGKQSDIYLYDFASQTHSKLTDDIFSDTYPVWSSDSKNIYFISDRNDNLSKETAGFKIWKYNVGMSDVYKINLDSKMIDRLTLTPDDEKSSIAISKDQTQLLYVSDKNGISNLYVKDLNTLIDRPITNSIVGISQISLSTDDSKVFFSSQIEAGYDIYSVKLPFERELGVDELPLTKLKQKKIDEEIILDNLTDDDFESVDEPLDGYGSFLVDFEDQKLVEPNIDVYKDVDERTVIEEGFDESEPNDEFVEYVYKPKLSTDLIFANPMVNTFWGFMGSTALVFSDVMGDHQLMFYTSLLMDIRNTDFYFSYDYRPEVVDYNASMYNFNQYLILNGRIQKFGKLGGGISARYPMDLFNRFELGFEGMYITRDDINDFNYYSKHFLMLPKAKYVHDDALYGSFGPLIGTRYNFEVIGTPALTDQALEFVTAKTDMRGYFPIADNFLYFAARLTGGISLGKTPQNFFMGGTEMWLNPTYNSNELPFNKAEDYAFVNMLYILPFRGWSVNAISGNKYALANIELKFPILWFLAAGPIPIFFQGMQGSFFLDAASAWDQNNVSEVRLEDGSVHEYDILFSSGIGIRTYFLGLPWKIDIAWRHEFDHWSKPEYLISWGYDF